MNVWTPMLVIENSNARDRQLVANVFNGSEKTSVAYRIDGTGTWKELEKTLRTDPYYIQFRERWELFGTSGLVQHWRESHPGMEPNASGYKQMPRLMESSHVWQTSLPSGLKEGRYLVEVRATDMFGRTFEDRHTFRVAP